MGRGGIVFTKTAASVWKSDTDAVWYTWGKQPVCIYWHSPPSFLWKTCAHKHTAVVVDFGLTTFGKAGSFLPGWASFCVIQWAAPVVIAQLGDRGEWKYQGNFSPQEWTHTHPQLWPKSSSHLLQCNTSYCSFLHNILPLKGCKVSKEKKWWF